MRYAWVRCSGLRGDDWDWNSAVEVGSHQTTIEASDVRSETRRKWNGTTENWGSRWTDKAREVQRQDALSNGLILTQLTLFKRATMGSSPSTLPT